MESSGYKFTDGNVLFFKHIADGGVEGWAYSSLMGFCRRGTWASVAQALAYFRFDLGQQPTRRGRPTYQCSNRRQSRRR